MESQIAVRALSALAHEGRLNIFRLLVRAGPDGLAAGDLARQAEIAPNTLSASLSILVNAGLAQSRREGRSMIYSAAFGPVADLIGYLVEDCCDGHAEVCEPVAAVTSRVRCCA